MLAPPRARTRSYARANALTPARRVRRGRVCWATVRSSDKKRKPSEKARERSVSHQRAGLTVAEMSSTFLLRKYYRRNVAADPRVQTRGNRSSGSCVRIPTCPPSRRGASSRLPRLQNSRASRGCAVFRQRPTSRGFLRGLQGLRLGFKPVTHPLGAAARARFARSFRT